MPATERYPPISFVHQVLGLTTGRLISLKSLKNVALSVKEQRKKSSQGYNFVC